MNFVKGFFQKSKLAILAAGLFSMFSLNVLATHIVGGEIYYDCLGNDQFKITVKVNRDCYNGIPPLDNPLYLGIYQTANSSLVTVLQLSAPVITNLPVILSNPCYNPPTNVCVEQGIYEATYTLPPIPGGYTFVYQRCCRNGTIVNLTDPGNVGATYFEAIPDSSIRKCNSSPRFKTYPPVAICSNLPFTYDHSATDPDGDSLVYELCDTYLGADAVNAVPTVPLPPPYTVVPWGTGYSGTAPLNSSPILAIDPNTGLMTGTPTMNGQFVVGVCVREYDKTTKGLIGIHRRDFQFNVTTCQAVTAPTIASTNTCLGGTTGTATVSWSTNKPPYIYIWTPNGSTTAVADPLGKGTYSVTVTDSSGCVATISVTVNENPYPTTQDSVKACPGDTMRIIAVPATSFHQWYGPTGTIITAPNGTNDSLLANNVQIGTQYIDSTSSEKGCKSRIVFTVKQKTIVGTLSTSPVKCFSTATGSATAVGSGGPSPYIYSWSTTPSQSGGTATGLIAGTYTVEVKSGNCVNTKSIVVTEPTDLSNTFNTVTPKCHEFKDGRTLAAASGGTAGYTYSWIAPSVSNKDSLNNIGAGTYTVQVIDANLCTKTFSVTLTQPPAIDSANIYSPYCEAATNLTLYTDGGGTYQWYNQSGQVMSGSNTDSVVVQPQVGDVFTVLVNPGLPKCPFRDTIIITPDYRPDVDFGEPVPNVFTPNGVYKPCEFVKLAKSFSAGAYYIDEFHIIIYNRWGKQVFESSDVTGMWDGKIDGGSDGNDGTYFWIATYTGKCINNPTKYEKKGFVQLIR